MGNGRKAVDVAFNVSPSYAQIEIRDRDNIEVPEWESGEELVVHNDSMVSVATRPDSDGDVVIRVVSELNGSVGGTEIFAGVLSLPSGILVVGNTLSEDLREIDLAPDRRVRISVLTDPPSLPQTVTVVLREKL